jgi:hypothetical protein
VGAVASCWGTRKIGHGPHAIPDGLVVLHMS